MEFSESPPLQDGVEGLDEIVGLEPLPELLWGEEVGKEVRVNFKVQVTAFS